MPLRLRSLHYRSKLKATGAANDIPCKQHNRPEQWSDQAVNGLALAIVAVVVALFWTGIGIVMTGLFIS